MSIASILGKIFKFAVKNEDEIRAGVKGAKKALKKVRGKKGT